MSFSQLKSGKNIIQLTAYARNTFSSPQRLFPSRGCALRWPQCPSRAGTRANLHTRDADATSRGPGCNCPPAHPLGPRAKPAAQTTMPILRFPSKTPNKASGFWYLWGWQEGNLFPSVYSRWHATFQSTGWPFSVVITEITFHHIVKLGTLQQLLPVLWVFPISNRAMLICSLWAESPLGCHPLTPLGTCWGLARARFISPCHSQ